MGGAGGAGVAGGAGGAGGAGMGVAHPCRLLSVVPILGLELRSSDLGSKSEHRTGLPQDHSPSLATGPPQDHSPSLDTGRPQALYRPVNGGKGPLIHEEMGDVWASFSHGCLDKKYTTVYCLCLLVTVPQTNKS